MKSLFDIQINGFAGVDFQSADLRAEELSHAVEALAERETSRFFVALITDSIESLQKKFIRLESIRNQHPAIGEAICGYHLEGPWLSAEDGFCGAHDPRHMSTPSIEDFGCLQKSANGNIRLVTLAPELQGSEEFIKQLVADGVEVSLGHTNAGEKAIDQSIAAGARFCTHLGNGVPAQLHRHDNVVQRLLSRDELTAFFIPDGVHLPPSVLQNFVRAKPSGKALFTTDCMSAAGAPTGCYTLAHLTLEVGDDRVVRMPGARNFAGSALCPDDGVANVEKWLEWTDGEARAAFSERVAKLFSINLPEIKNDRTIL